MKALAPGQNKTFHLGLTGGIGSGKSTVARLFAACGAFVIDADVVSRGVTGKEGLAMPAIVEQFGPQVLASDGALDRQVMREIVYASPTARQHLERIVHPFVEKEMERQALEAERLNVPCVVFEVPLLVENLDYWRPRLDAILVIDCPERVQMDRVMLRDGLSEEDVRKILLAQVNREQRLAAADFVIRNGDDVTPELLSKQLEAMLPHFGL